MPNFLVSTMTWSYSRLKAYEDCPYAWCLKYLECEQGESNFFAEYGSLIHKILEQFYTGKMKRTEMLPYYLQHFYTDIQYFAPTDAIYWNYYRQGMNYLCEFIPISRQIAAVEQKVEFELDGRPFCGFVDLRCEWNGECVVDHKSRTLSPRSTRKKPTQSDKELDSYLRQLYLYSVPQKPDWLVFNCFRSGQVIQEKFNEDAFERTKEWALKTIFTLENNEDWSPNPDYFKCKYLCDMRYLCDFRDKIL